MKICIFEVEGYYYDYDDVTRHIPVGEFKDISEKDFTKYSEYVKWRNNKRRGGKHLQIVRLWPEMSWDTFDKEVAEELKKKEEATRKRKEAAAKRKAEKEAKAREKELAELAKLKEKYENDK